MPWTTIAITVASLALVVGLIVAIVRVWGGKKVAEVKRDIAEDEAERRAKDAEIAARPYPARPLDELFK